MRSFSWYAHQKRTSGVVGRGTYPALFDCLDDNLRDIFDLHLLFGLYAFNAVIKHGNAERTGSSEDFSPRIQCLIYTRLIDAFADRFFHPCATTTASAAEALVAIAFHLSNAITIEDFEHLAGLIKYIIIAPDVAWVVIGQLTLVKTLGKRNGLIGQQAIDVRGMMDHLIVATKLWILVLDSIEAVWAGSQKCAMLCNSAVA